MFEVAFSLENSCEKRTTALNNLLVLAREPAGANIMFKEGIASKIRKLIKVERNEEIIIASIRLLSELFKDNSERTEIMLQEFGIPWLLDMINSRNEDRVNASQYCIQV